MAGAEQALVFERKELSETWPERVVLKPGWRTQLLPFEQGKAVPLK